MDYESLYADLVCELRSRADRATDRNEKQALIHLLTWSANRRYAVGEPRPHFEPDEVQQNLVAFSKQGAKYWPGAAHFEGFEIDAKSGQLTGESWLICRGCVKRAAELALSRLPSKVLVDIVGQPNPQVGLCDICEEEI